MDAIEIADRGDTTMMVRANVMTAAYELHWAVSRGGTRR